MAAVKIVELIDNSTKALENTSKNPLAEAAKTIWIVKWLNDPEAGMPVLSTISLLFSKS